MLAYVFEMKGNKFAVIAESIADACDKIESKTNEPYKFIHSCSFDVINPDYLNAELEELKNKAIYNASGPKPIGYIMVSDLQHLIDKQK